MGDGMQERIQRLSEDYDTEISARYHSLKPNLIQSKEKLESLSKEIAASPISAQNTIETIAVAGSYARLEASALSDFDVLVVLNNDSDQTRAHRTVLDFIASKGYPAPNPKGVFAQPVTIQKLTSVAGGTHEEYGDLSRRILLLLESRPVYKKDSYKRLMRTLIDTYASDVLEQTGRKTKNFVFLLNDIIRYFRTICVNYQYTKEVTEWGKWPIRNIKLRHSRILMYFSLVASLGILSTYFEDDKVEVLAKLIEAEPLRRLYIVYNLAGDTSFFRVAGYYNVFLDSLNNDEVRKKLAEIDYDDRYASREFTILKTNSDAFAAELLRFLDARRGTWSDRFFEYLVL
jgi:predicted nucleotidyltransferase